MLGRMKKFMILHYGFAKPTPMLMEAWGNWFVSIADRQLDQGGFVAGREISRSGSQDLPWDADCITGYNIIEAEDLASAEQIARQNPYVSGIRVYEIRTA